MNSRGEVGTGELLRWAKAGKVYKGHWLPGAWASASCAQGSRGVLVLLTPYPLLAGVAPSSLPVPPSPSSLPCSTQRSVAAAWRGTLWHGEQGPRRLQRLSLEYLSLGLDVGRETKSVVGDERRCPSLGLSRGEPEARVPVHQLSSWSSSSINLSFCLNASGKHVPDSIGERDCLNLLGLGIGGGEEGEGTLAPPFSLNRLGGKDRFS